MAGMSMRVGGEGRRLTAADVEAYELPTSS